MSPSAAIDATIVTSPRAQLRAWPRWMIQARMNGASAASRSSQRRIGWISQAENDPRSPSIVELGLFALVAYQARKTATARSAPAPMPTSSLRCRRGAVTAAKPTRPTRPRAAPRRRPGRSGPDPAAQHAPRRRAPEPSLGERRVDRDEADLGGEPHAAEHVEAALEAGRRRRRVGRRMRPVRQRHRSVGRLAREADALDRRDNAADHDRRDERVLRAGERPLLVGELPIGGLAGAGAGPAGGERDQSDRVDGPVARPRGVDDLPALARIGEAGDGGVQREAAEQIASEQPREAEVVGGAPELAED